MVMGRGTGEVPLPIEGRVWSISSPLQAGCGAKPQPPKDFMPSKDKSERFGNGSRDGTDWVTRAPRFQEG